MARQHSADLAAQHGRNNGRLKRARPAWRYNAIEPLIQRLTGAVVNLQQVYSPGRTPASNNSSSSQVPDQAPDSRTEVVEQRRNAERLGRSTAPFIELTQDRITELRAVAKQFPGGHRHLDRLEFALRRGPVNALEALHLGSMHVPARVLALRSRGFEIGARWVRVLGLDGELHRVHEWRLVGSPEAGEVA